jgi:hypothetical protein
MQATARVTGGKRVASAREDGASDRAAKRSKANALPTTKRLRAKAAKLPRPQPRTARSIKSKLPKATLPKATLPKAKRSAKAHKAVTAHTKRAKPTPLVTTPHKAKRPAPLSTSSAAKRVDGKPPLVQRASTAVTHRAEPITCASCGSVGRSDSAHAHVACRGGATAAYVDTNSWRVQKQHWLCGECALSLVRTVVDPMERVGSNRAALCPFCPTRGTVDREDQYFERREGTPLELSLADGLTGVSASMRDRFRRRVRELGAYSRTTMGVTCVSCDALCVAPRASVVQATGIRCRACGTATCSVCRGEHHPKETCKGKAVMAGAAASEGVRQCHRCGLPFKHYRGDGCHDVDCACGAVTCAVCGGDPAGIAPCKCPHYCDDSCKVCPVPS